METMHVTGYKPGNRVNPSTSVHANIPVGPMTRELCRSFAAEHGCNQVHIYETKCYHQGRVLPFAEWPADETAGREYTFVETAARYDVAKDSLVIWRNNQPIYSNDRGIVCRDEVALADTISQE
jgi:hypothetical protein